MFSIIFFGSFQHYSVLTLEALHRSPDIKIVGVVTTPPRPGDRGVITPTAVHQYCLDHQLPVLPLENLETLPPELEKPDFIIVAGFGKLINEPWLNFPKIMPINAHQSLLPNYAGRFPAEWAILKGETHTGVTLIKMSPHFDQGDILTQATIPILPTDTRQTLYDKLYRLSADLIIATLPKINQITPRPQSKKGFYARQLTRNDGFVTWANFLDPKFIPQLDTLYRALHPWPGVWTTTPESKRLKIVATHPLTVQLEGKTAILWDQVKNSLVKKNIAQ